MSGPNLSIEVVFDDPRIAHATLFGHRHPVETPSFHWSIIDMWHSSIPRALFLAFRGAGKSTLAEEAIIIEALFQKFSNAIVLGASYERAVERLRSIKHELENNLYIERVFGSQVGSIWSESRIVLANGAIIQAYGRGQSLRGAKHLDKRPDRCFCDDIEDEESVATELARKKTLDWFVSTVLPALEPQARIRIAATPLHPEALSMVLTGPTQGAWPHLKVPIVSLSPETGQPTPAWPDKFSLSYIEGLKKSYEALGAHDKFQQEYMCEAEDAATKPFTSGMFRTEPRVRTWEAVYAYVDPARSTNKTSAATGVAIWSWINNRLIVWDSYARLWKPDEIIGDMFRVNEVFSPVAIGVEQDGLSEFILQPLRQAQATRGVAIPIRPLRAPRGKLDFIRALQPFFNAGEVIFVGECADLKAELLNFPRGRIDAPNALAYALAMRPGAAVYEDFTHGHIVADLEPVGGGRGLNLAVNATADGTTAVLSELVEGGIHVLADWAAEGDPGVILSSQVREALSFVGAAPRLVAPPSFFTGHDPIGLRAAAAKIPIEVRRGGDVAKGREEVRALLRRQIKGRPAFLVSSNARWTLNALSGGYCRRVTKSGVLSEFPEPSVYRTLMEGLESFAGLMRISEPANDPDLNYAFTSTGRRFISARAT